MSDVNFAGSATDKHACNVESICSSLDPNNPKGSVCYDLDTESDAESKPVDIKIEKDESIDSNNYID